MLKNKGKISIKQVMILFILTSYNPAVRFIPNYTTQKAKQAAWLAPLVTFIIYLALIYMYSLLFKKYKNKNFADIVSGITSKFWGKLVLIIYLLYFTLALGGYLRYYSEILVGSVYPNVEINIFIIVMLFLLAIVVKSGITVIARMTDIIFIILSFILMSYMVLMIPSIKIDYITPISSLDIVPILKASVGTTALKYLPVMFLFSDKWSRTNEFFKQGIKACLYLFVLDTFIIITCIGTLGASLTARTPLAFFISVKNISLLGVLVGFESALTAIMIVTDFILMVVFLYSAMAMIKSLVNLKDHTPLINIYLVTIYLLGWLVAENFFELEALVYELLVYVKITILVILPIIIFIIGKIRKKI
ncbi:GerAB/ArcD/ProY family transporter [Mycoplasmatota bacterium WC44]